MSEPIEKCPVCDGPPGRGRFGTCSAGCDMVTGQPTDWTPLVGVLTAVLIIALIIFLTR